MSRMLWREANRCRWVGIRPAHEGAQVLKSATATNQTLTLYTVPAGGVLYLLSAELHQTAGACSAYLSVLDDAAVLQYVLGRVSFASSAGFHFTISQQFFPPMELPAGWTITLASPNAGVSAGGSIYGWLE